MRRKIWGSICTVCTVAILVTAVLITCVIYRESTYTLQKEIKREAHYLAAGVHSTGEHYLDTISAYSGSTRITLIAADGTVLFDNEAEPSAMENHSARPEFLTALRDGAGSDTRVSETLRTQTYYYAVRLETGSVLRVAGTADSVLTAVMNMVPLMLLCALAVFILALIFAQLQTRKIVEPINRIPLEHPEETVVYEELSPLLKRIAKQNATIKENMETIKRKQLEFTAITENMSEGFLVIDSRGDVLSYNASALRILNVRVKQVHRQSILTINRSLSFRKAVDAALRGTPCDEPMPLGSRHYQLLANPVKDNDTIIGAVIIILDDTEKQSREQLRREFSANVSHELKTPLTSISGYAEIIKNGIARDEDVRGFSENIYKEAQRMIALVDDIMKLSQLDEGSLSFQKEAVDLYALAADTLHQLRIPAEARGITLALSGDHAKITGIRHLLSELIYNLIDNAIKYNLDNGSVKVTLTASAPPAAGQTGFVTLTVSDTGLGIKKEDLDRVFERFYRTDKSHSKQIGGTGLGLSIVKHAAMYHDAEISLDSTEGEGTTVTVKFPNLLPT